LLGARVGVSAGGFVAVPVAELVPLGGRVFVADAVAVFAGVGVSLGTEVVLAVGDGCATVGRMVVAVAATPVAPGGIRFGPAGPLSHAANSQLRQRRMMAAHGRFIGDGVIKVEP
jgi:hypothetical protein